MIQGPITLLSTMGKLLERVIKKHLDAYSWTFETISQRQYGFQQGRSTEDAVLALLEKISQLLKKDKRKILTVLSYDNKGAFDNLKWKVILEEFIRRWVTLGDTVNAEED